MRRLLFSLVSTKIPHSPSHGITAAAVLKDIPNASAVFRISGYIGDLIRFDGAKDEVFFRPSQRVYESHVFSCSSVKRSIAATASAADSSRACRKKRPHRACPHAQMSSLQLLCVPCSKVEITCPSYP